MLPSLVETPGILYFRTRRKLDLFDITDGAKKMQTNFIIDKGFKISKGSDLALSMQMEEYRNQLIAIMKLFIRIYLAQM